MRFSVGFVARHRKLGPRPVQKTVKLLDLGSGKWIVPDDWSNDNNSVTCRGGKRSAPQSDSKSNLKLTPGASVPYSIGTASGGDTWFGGDTFDTALVRVRGAPGARLGFITIRYLGLA